ncbi:(Fe-S)-binding protein [Tepidimicrobium xylanilyticum]|uniref:Fe-S oxidoreductase n=1 Tax=Tepidimicrobium xylanilyticum TaxID=1123352 RepID=A0A1H3E803_9FIRM|nr:(Fe-S)-binding protein [Tepidimicrobium xylanilyticum]SDX74019.1 Fe-S oxidoreductase [Tepidimicrobium xylanilyticum]
MKISDKSMKYIIEEQKCIGCNACMKGCPMLGKFCDSPKILLRELLETGAFDYRLPYSCMLCGYCTEVCPKGVDLKELFLELRRDAVNETKGNLPKELRASAVDMHQRFSFSAIFTSNIENLQSDVVFFPGCALMSHSPKIVYATYKYLRGKISGMGIYNKCCGKPTRFMGKEDKFQEYFSLVENEFKNKKVKRVITGCQNCFMTISENSNTVETISLWEVLADVGIPEDRRNLGLIYNFTIHDPCPTRGEEKIHESIRKIIKEFGLNVKEMKFNRRKTLCCGSGGMVGLTQPNIAREHTNRRANEADTDYIITYCQECVESMRRGGKNSYHILDLLFNDDFESIEKNKSTLGKWINRYKGKHLGRK